MAKKKPVEESEIELEGEGAEESPAQPDPEKHLCFEGAYVEHPEAGQRSRVISYAGANFEHTHEDAQGIWCYHRM